MDLNELFEFLMEDFIFDRILEHSLDSHTNDLFKKDDSFVISRMKIQNTEETMCQICLETIEKEELVYDLQCKHHFHSVCLEESVSFQHYDCPTCREKISVCKKNEHTIVYNEN